MEDGAALSSVTFGFPSFLVGSCGRMPWWLMCCHDHLYGAGGESSGQGDLGESVSWAVEGWMSVHF